MSEVWKDIEGYEGRYQVSNLGRIRSIPHTTISTSGKKRPFQGKILRTHILSSGYRSVCVRKPNKRILVHRAVAIAFVPGYFDGAQVNHKDENKRNNRVDNLEWVTAKENINYGTHNSRCHNWVNENQAIAVEQYATDGSYVKSYPSLCATARAMGVCVERIRVAIKTQGKVKGYLFKRKTN